jgi:enoyl-CoA hydratase/carnithine racemase
MDATTQQQAPALLSVEGHIATITLNRPDRFNAIDIDMARCLLELSERVRAAGDIRVLVLRGSGAGFCAGGDLHFITERIEDIRPPVTDLLLFLHQFLLTLRRMDKLVVTSIHGSAAGAGLSLAFMGDFCVAAENARFRPAYAALGVSPDAGGTVGIVDALGPRRALQVFLAEDEFDGVRAAALGLVTLCVPEAHVDAQTLAFAGRLCRLDPAAAAATKALIWRSAARSVDEQLNAEMAELLACMERDGFRTRVRKFARS